MGEPLQLHIEIEGTHALPAGVVDAVVRHALVLVGIDSGIVDLGVQFVDEQTISVLNRDYRGQERPTDVLSFPIDETAPLPPGMPRQLGDIVVCPTWVEQQVREGNNMSPAGTGDDHHDANRRFDSDVPMALRRCIAHGALHLLGEDHELGERESERMFELEQLVLDATAEVEG